MKRWEIITTTAGTLNIEGLTFGEAIKSKHVPAYIGNVIGIKTL